MGIFKCKMCGGDLEINTNALVATCEYCGTQQTLPKLDDDRRANLYDRANHFRRNNEFDKAMGIYERILNEDRTDAEAYWSLVLCRYGIEYVEDPASHKCVPTVNRAQFTSVFDDDNYKSALQYADASQRSIYEEEAGAINEIQKGILAISQKEEPFDVFICYKETDNNGRRTPDSVLANDLYHQLTQEGFKVFFSRITLEDKLGSAYEPYIFAALNSAKVMVVLGTKPEHFNAVWVKNEWSRYLALIKNGAKKTLIPAYKDMDPYDLPEEFSHLQAQDMSKLGFMQDLIRGIQKLASTAEAKPAAVKETVAAAAVANTAPLLRRAFMFLEDGEFERADAFCEQVLNQEPENAQAYLGKLMAELGVKLQEDLKDQAEPFDARNNYKKVLRFGDEKLKAALTGYIEHIITRNEEEKKRAEEEKKKCDQLFKEYKTAVQTERNSVVKKAEANKKLSSLHTEYDNFANLKTNWQSIEGDLFSHNERLKSIQTEIGSLNHEKSNLGFFAGKRKREIADRIVSLEGKRQSLSGDIIFLQKKKQGYNTISEVESEIARTFQQIEEQKKIIEELSCARSSQTIRNELSVFDLGKKLLQKFDFLQNIKKGNYITFGTYEQDNNTSNGKEDIEWRVLEIKDGKALVISKYALDCKQYNTKRTDVTWKTCSLRKWLNSDFINSAFSADEKAMIPTVTVSADKNEYSTNPSNATQDKVFLLSITEANKYFSFVVARRCKATDYAVANGAYVCSSKGTCWWWLRSPGFNQGCAAGVYSGGDVNEGGNDVYDANGAVRPALWIDLNAKIF